MVKEHIDTFELSPPEPECEGVQVYDVSCRILPVSIAFLCILLLVAISIAFLYSMPNGPEAVHALLIVLVQLISLPIILLCATNINIKLSQSGIVVSSNMHKTTMLNRPHRDWSDLHSVRLKRMKSSQSGLINRIDLGNTDGRKNTVMGYLKNLLVNGWLNRGFLILDFKSGGMVAFPLAGFSPKALEMFFEAISRFANPMSLNPDVISLQRRVLTGQSPLLDQSYTKVWEESLRQSFEVTNFVPLPGGHLLSGGKIKILMLLACGGMSSVYLARLEDDTTVVVKEMKVPLDGEPELAQKVHDMFSNEAKILSRLDHEHIVRVLDHFVESSRDYLVLEYVPGLTLRQSVQLHGPIGQVEVIDIGMQLAQIIKYLHGFDPSILHRDLTPDNLIMRESSKSLMLVDFGAANEYIGHLTGTLIGKQCYIPPEQFRGKAEPASDIYAVCATLYFLLTGVDPEPITSSSPRLLNDTIDGDLDLLIQKGTAESTNQRIKDAQELYDELAAIKLKVGANWIS